MIYFSMNSMLFESKRRVFSLFLKSNINDRGPGTVFEERGDLSEFVFEGYRSPDKESEADR